MIKNIIIFLFVLSFGLFADSQTTNLGLNKLDFSSNFNSWHFSFNYDGQESLRTK